MRVTLITLIVFVTFSTSAQSSVRDSANFVLLRDGQRLYSSRIQLKFTPAADKYLELGDHRQIPIEQVSRFKVPEGSFVIVPGSAGYDVYKVEKEGQRLSTYSRVVTDPAHASEPGYHGTVELYFRRTDQEKMTPANFHSLQNAIKDNPASLHELNLARNPIRRASLPPAHQYLSLWRVSMPHTTIPTRNPPLNPGRHLPLQAIASHPW